MLGCRTLRLESQSSAGLKMQLYPRSPDLVLPGYLHGTGCLSARAMETGFPTVVWRLCLGLGFAVTPPTLARVQGVCVWVQVLASPSHSWLGIVVRAFGFGFRGNPASPGWGLGCVCLGMGFGCAPPIFAGVCGACVWGWVSRQPRHSRLGSRVCVFGYGFWLRPANFRWGLWCVCLGVGFSCTPLLLARMLRCMPSWARSARTPPPPAGAACGKGLCGGRRRRGFSPPLFFFFFAVFLAGGGGICGCGSRPCCVRALWWSLSPLSVLAPLVSAPPLPFVWVPPPLFFCCVCVRVAGGLPFLRWGCALACPGCLYLRAFGGCVVTVGRCFCLAGRLAPRCPIGGPRVCRLWWCLAGGRPPLWSGCAALWLCDGPPIFLLSRWPAGVCSWLNWASPVLCFFFFFFSGGGFACSSLCLPWAGARTGQQTVWLTASLLALWVAAGRAPAPWVVWAMYTLGLVACPVGLGSGSAGWAVARAGFVMSWVRGGGVVPFSPAPAVPVWWWRV